MGIKTDRLTYSSDYFGVIMDYGVQLIKEEKAYVDDTEILKMRETRSKGEESPCRSRSVEENLKLFEEMKKGTEIGFKCCVRAKIDPASNNLTMRDPIMFRCKNEIHPRQGDKYKVYPTYDFTCPIVDSLEGVTHTLRTRFEFLL
jgi:glutamyl/glutaminyl-tRNA synthetase